MRDKLDGLSDFLIKMSRFPGLGFLVGHAESLVNMKHQVEAHISNIECQKQGVEEGLEAVRGLGPKSKRDAAAVGENTVPGADGGLPPGTGGRGVHDAASSPATAASHSQRGTYSHPAQPTGATQYASPAGYAAEPAPSGGERRQPVAVVSKEAKAKQKLARALQKRSRR